MYRVWGDMYAINFKVLHFLLFLFSIVCVFDPADTIIGMKVWIFISILLTGCMHIIMSGFKVRVPYGLLGYTVCFIAVPVASIVCHALREGGFPVQAFPLLKGYLLVFLVLILVQTRIDILHCLSGVLSILSLLIIGTFFAIMMSSSLFLPLKDIGNNLGLFYLDYRDYGYGIIVCQVYYVTAPMLVIPISYYLSKIYDSANLKIYYFLLVIINITGMFLSGTRNTIIISVALPLVIMFVYSRKKIWLVFPVGLFFLLVCWLSFPYVLAFFDPSEYSNAIKIGYIQDYIRILSDSVTLCYGRGLGASDYFYSVGGNRYITELTYLETVRSFGLFGSVIIFGLLIFPIWFAFRLGVSKKCRALVVAYEMYLLMCATNPNLFNSMGILVLSVVLSCLYIEKQSRKLQLVGRGCA